MLPRTYRFSPRSQTDFFSRAKVCATPLFVVYALLQDVDGPTQFAVIVSKKQVASAVLRNSIKRKVHGLLWELVVTGQVQSGWRLAIVAKPAILNRDSVVVLQSFTQVFAKVMK